MTRSAAPGTINGTTYFIPTKMTDAVAGGAGRLCDGAGRGRAAGFAERDPTADVEGFDAGVKAAIIATVAFGAKFVAGDVYDEVISGTTGAEIAIAASTRLRREPARHRRA